MNNRYNKALTALMGMALCMACTDEWNDHYAEGGQQSGGTLWESIKANSELSNFASVVEACGYDVTLNGSQTYTIYAPTNQYFSKEKADSIIQVYNTNKAQGVRTAENPAIRQFLQNHIALYKKPVSTLTNDTISMMNSKYQMLTPTTVGNRQMLSSNTLCGNGVLFTIDGTIAYYPNVFEYLGTDAELDSVYQFLKSFNVYEFDPNQSVPGGINANGETEYLDSVSVLNNPFFRSYGEINSEDSSYVFLAPTNSEWNRLVAEYEPYFVYATNVNKRDSLQHTNARVAAISYSAFNANDAKNKSLQDSVVSTSYSAYNGDDPYGIFYKPYDAGKGIFAGTTEADCSNGKVLKASDYRISSYQTFNQIVKIEGESTYYVDTLNNVEDPVTVVEVTEDNPFYNKISSHSLVKVIPDLTAVDADHKPTIRYTVSGLLSNVGYDVYVVFAPALAVDTLASDEDRLPCRFQGRVNYTTLDGNEGTYNFTTRSNNMATNFTTGKEGQRVDTVVAVRVLNNKKFPTSSLGLDQSGIKVTIMANVEQNQTSKYTRTMLIDCIRFVPHDRPSDLWTKE